MEAAVMVAVPLLTPVMMPRSLTVATVSSEDFQVTPSGFTPKGLTSAFRAAVPPLYILMDCLSRVTDTGPLSSSLLRLIL